MCGGLALPVVKSRVVLIRPVPPPSCSSPESITATVTPAPVRVVSGAVLGQRVEPQRAAQALGASAFAGTSVAVRLAANSEVSLKVVNVLLLLVAAALTTGSARDRR